MTTKNEFILSSLQNLQIHSWNEGQISHICLKSLQTEVTGQARVAADVEGSLTSSNPKDCTVTQEGMLFFFMFLQQFYTF